MAEVCTDTQSPGSCGHFVVTVGGVTLHLHESELTPLTDSEREQLLRLAVRHRGVALANLLNRVVVGDEATNVKQYTIIGAGAAVTKTNVGTSYVNVLVEANGGRALVEFTGCTEYRIVLNALLAGSGTYSIRMVRDGDSAVLFEQTGIAAQAGERELDTDWQPIPAAASGLELVRLQASASVGANDPIFRRCVMLVR